MKRTYQVTVEMPDSYKDVSDWKVEQLIAGQIERATVKRQGDPKSQPLRVTKVDHIATELTLTDPVENLLNSFFDILGGGNRR